MPIFLTSALSRRLGPLLFGRAAILAAATLLSGGRTALGDCAIEPQSPQDAFCSTIPTSSILSQRSLYIALKNPEFKSTATFANDPLGPWSFGYAINGMAPPNARCPIHTVQSIPELDEANCSPAAQVRRNHFLATWMMSWQSTGTSPNGNVAGVRTSLFGMFLSGDRSGKLWTDTSEILSKTMSGSCSSNGINTADPMYGCQDKVSSGTCSCQILDLSKSPFVPTAIVYRPDQFRTANGIQTTGGEGRVVYSALGVEGPSFPFLLILEYALNITGASGFSSPSSWALAWKNLSAITTDSSYAPSLASLTRRFMDSGRGGEAAPNASSLAQARTNDFLLGPWQLREFHLSASSGNLELNQTATTPDDRFRVAGSAAQTALVNWITANSSAICQGKTALPNTLTVSALASPVLAGASNSQDLGGQPLSFAGAWASPINLTQPNLQKWFNINTCNGCHTLGASNPLGGSLGFTHTDPVTGAPSTFLESDLARRRNQMKCYLNSQCCSGTGFTPSH